LAEALSAGDEERIIDLLGSKGFTGWNAKVQLTQQTVLLWALKKGRQELAMEVAENAAFVEINKCAHACQNALHMAAKAGLSDHCLEILSRADFKEVNAKDLSAFSKMSSAEVAAKLKASDYLVKWVD